MTEIYDISLPLHVKSITYPGNPNIEFEEIRSSTGGSVLTKIAFGSHTGTHIDAPSHAMIENGETIDGLSLELFHGQTRVLDLTEVIDSVGTGDLESKNIQAGERILLKTSNSARWKDGEFFPDFVYLSSEGAEYLAAQGVILVGIDSLSIKQKGSSDNRPHTNLLEKGIPIIEGLDLSTVEEGEYVLSAFPLKFIGIDGSPCRAVLTR